jgi:hypothetical protein
MKTTTQEEESKETAPVVAQTREEEESSGIGGGEKETDELAKALQENLKLEDTDDDEKEVVKKEEETSATRETEEKEAKEKEETAGDAEKEKTAAAAAAAEKEEAIPKEEELLSTAPEALRQIARWIQEGSASNILVLTGAGVSVAAGIPDFRTPGTGLYDNLQKHDLPYAEAIFDVQFYRRNPRPFVTLAKEIWPGVKHVPTLTHSFVALLAEKQLLLRNYSQNIDGLGKERTWVSSTVAYVVIRIDIYPLSLTLAFIRRVLSWHSCTEIGGMSRTLPNRVLH